MNAGRVLKQARRRAGLSQRELARRWGLHQPAIARIENGRVDPRVSTLDRLLRACGEELVAEEVLGTCVDRSMIRLMLEMPPRERVEQVVAAGRDMAVILGANKRPGR